MTKSRPYDELDALRVILGNTSLAFCTEIARISMERHKKPMHEAVEILKAAGFEIAYQKLEIAGIVQVVNEMCNGEGRR